MRALARVSEQVALRESYHGPGWRAAWACARNVVCECGLGRGRDVTASVSGVIMTVRGVVCAVMWAAECEPDPWCKAWEADLWGDMNRARDWWSRMGAWPGRVRERAGGVMGT